MRVLVIGGTHFIGLEAVRQLAEGGHAVAVFNRGKSPADLPQGVERITGDLSEIAAHRDAFARFAPDVVLHNILWNEADAARLLDAVRGVAPTRQTPRLVMSSSMDVYAAFGRVNWQESGEPTQAIEDEDAPLRTGRFPYREPNSTREADPFTYDYDKIPAEHLLLNTPGVRACVLRLPMVYGAGDKQHRLAQWVWPVQDGRPYMLMDSLYAAWRTTFGAVENVAAALVRACEDERANGRVYNVGDATPTMLDWGERVAFLMDWDGTMIVVPVEDTPAEMQAPFNARQHLAFSSERIRRELDYKPRLDTDDALRRGIVWELAHRASPETSYAEEDAFLNAHPEYRFENEAES